MCQMMHYIKIMNEEYGRIWIETLLVYIKLLHNIYCVLSMKTISVRISDPQAQIHTNISNIK
jgi:hypothetical protein